MNPYDITKPNYISQWPRWAAGYLNQASIQQELGVPLNFTQSSDTVFSAFAATGDGARGRYIQSLGNLLDLGVKVALIYGDRDFQCNWIGGEAVSIAIPYDSDASFKATGYANMVTDNYALGGMTRQYGNLSFSRVFQAGHEVPYDQPEVAYNIFMRTILGKDVATGNSNVTNTYSTNGDSNANATQTKVSISDHPVPTCYLWSVQETCSDDQIKVLQDGRGVIRDSILVSLLPLRLNKSILTLTGLECSYIAN